MIIKSETESSIGGCNNDKKHVKIDDTYHAVTVRCHVSENIQSHATGLSNDGLILAVHASVLIPAAHFSGLT